MGFMDRVKEAAQEVAVEAKKVSAQAQGKLEGTQLKRRMDDTAKQLGYLVHKERTQGVVEGAEAERLLAEITSLELQMAKSAADARAKQEVAEQTGQPAGQEAETQPPQSDPRPPAGPGATVVPPSGEAVAPPPPSSSAASEPPPPTP